LIDLLIYWGMEAVWAIFLGSWVLLIALPIISKILDTFVNYDVIKINKHAVKVESAYGQSHSHAQIDAGLPG